MPKIKKISLASRIKYIEDLKKEIIIQEEAIKLIESYVPSTIQQRIVHEYAIEGAVVFIANKLNEEGLRLGNRKYISNDISEVLRLKPTDQLHEITNKAFEHNSDNSNFK